MRVRWIRIYTLGVILKSCHYIFRGPTTLTVSMLITLPKFTSALVYKTRDLILLTGIKVYPEKVTVAHTWVGLPNHTAQSCGMYHDIAATHKAFCCPLFLVIHSAKKQIDPKQISFWSTRWHNTRDYRECFEFLAPNTCNSWFPHFNITALQRWWRR